MVLVSKLEFSYCTILDGGPVSKHEFSFCTIIDGGPVSKHEFSYCTILDGGPVSKLEFSYYTILDGGPVSKHEFMRCLGNLEHLLIRAKYHSDQLEGNIFKPLSSPFSVIFHSFSYF